jgi:hypothetical protein
MSGPELFRVGNMMLRNAKPREAEMFVERADYPAHATRDLLLSSQSGSVWSSHDDDAADLPPLVRGWDTAA